MIQEIITYMIIGAAVALAVSKAIGKIKGKKSVQKNVNFQKDTFSMQHNCSDCSAECMLRDYQSAKATNTSRPKKVNT